MLGTLTSKLESQDTKKKKKGKVYSGPCPAVKRESKIIHGDENNILMALKTLEKTIRI